MCLTSKPLMLCCLRACIFESCKLQNAFTGLISLELTHCPLLIVGPQSQRGWGQTPYSLPLTREKRTIWLGERQALVPSPRTRSWVPIWKERSTLCHLMVFTCSAGPQHYDCTSSHAPCESSTCHTQMSFFCKQQAGSCSKERTFLHVGCCILSSACEVCWTEPSDRRVSQKTECSPVFNWRLTSLWGGVGGWGK